MSLRPETEPNNFADSSATSINLGDTFAGSLSSSSDWDFCKFSITSRGVIGLDFVASLISSNFYYDIRIYDAAGNQILAEDFASSSASISLGLQAAGTYYASVTSTASHYSAVPYQLSIRSVAGNASDYEWESNDSLAAANTLALGQTMHGQLGRSSDADWFHVTATAAGTLVIDFSASQSDLPSFEVGIYDATGAQLQTRQTDHALSLSAAVLGPGDYYVRISQASNYDGGNYALAVRNDSFSTMAAKALASGSRVTLNGSHDWYSVSLTAGTCYEFACKGSTTSGNTLADPALSLAYANGATLETCDDLLVWSSASNASTTTADALIAFTAPATGTYYLLLSGSGGTGTVTVSKTTDSISSLIPSLLDLQTMPDHRWKPSASSPLGTGVALTYAFLTANPTSDSETGFRAMTAAEKTAVVAVLGLYARVANLRFSLTTDEGSANLRFGTSNQGNASAGMTYNLEGGSGLVQADVFLNNASTSTITTLTAGGRGYQTLIHETGHALGLKHPGDYNAGSATPHPPFLFPEHAPWDSQKFSVMSYLDNPDATIYSSTPAPLDIAALQYLYGIPSLSPQTFSFSNTAPFVTTLLGYGSSDTLSISNQTLPSTIFLTAGSMSSIGPGSAGSVAHDNVAIPFSESIANVIDGPAADFILGNNLDNKFYGFTGADTIDGGGGSNSLVLGATSTSLNLASDAQLVNVHTVDAATATSINVDLHLQSEAITVAGSSGGDTIVASAGGGTIAGGGGNDTISGGLGNTTAVYVGARAGYAVTVTANGLMVEDKVGNEGTDTLSGVARVQMAGTKFAFDWDGSAGKTARIIAAAFGTSHLHDSLSGNNLVALGLEYFDQGYSVHDVAAAAVNCTLFHQLVGSPTPTVAAVVTLLYTNVVGHAPEPAELDHFTRLGLSPTELLVLAAESVPNADQLTLLGLPQGGLDYV